MEGIRHFIGAVLTVLVALIVAYIAWKLLVGLVKLLVIGAAIGVGAVLAGYLIHKFSRSRHVARRY